MAARHSLVAQSINSVLNRSVQKHLWLRTLDSCIDPSDILDKLYTQPLKDIEDLKAKLPPHARKTLKYDKQREINIWVPAPQIRYATTGTAPVETLQHFSKFSEGLLRIPHDGYEENNRTVVPAVALKIRCKYDVPTPYQYSLGEWATNTRIEDGVVLSADMMGETTFMQYAAVAHKLVLLNTALSYAESFGKATSRMCTTPGIIKLLWPECTTFLHKQALTDAVAKAKASSMPVAARRQLSGYSVGSSREAITLEYFRKQLTAVTNVCLSAELMPCEDEHITEQKANEPIAHITEIQTGFVRLKQL
jgi:hypothetical protein